LLSTRTTGTTPDGIHDPGQAARWVRGMFSRIAPRYDLLNHVLSLNIDRHWRAVTVRRLAESLSNPEARILDVACGTGDLMLALGARGNARVFGSDFCHPMLLEAGAKAGGSAKLFEADALQLPLADGSLDLATIAFGFRNLASYEQGLHELRRILKPGGVLAILEFSTPPNPLLAGLYGFYSRSILPLVGGWISGSREAYTYLPESVRKFPSAGELANQMRAAGFANVRFHRMTAGIVALHLGDRL
jgi:demethylmenaquinone methyltransferase / 2-methoxy-6-polyprenyl-1,4-benzoquinol methylase